MIFSLAAPEPIPFIFGVGSGRDHITDFKRKEVIAINGVTGVDDFSDLTIVNAGGNAVISWGTGDSITLDGVRASALSAADFSFSASAAPNVDARKPAIARRHRSSYRQRISVSSNWLWLRRDVRNEWKSGAHANGSFGSKAATRELARHIILPNQEPAQGRVQIGWVTWSGAL